MAFPVKLSRPVGLALLLAAVTAAVYHHALALPFVGWDDFGHVCQNPFLHPVTAAHIARFWTAPYEFLYIPVVYTLFAGLSLAAHLPAPVPLPGAGTTDLDARVFHAANLIVHCANVVLVFALVRRVVKQDWPAFAGALLFAAHPVQVESVAWVSEMRGLLSAFFSLLALLLYAREEGPLTPNNGGAEEYSPLAPPLLAAGRAFRFALATVCFALALLCKPSAVCLPLLAWAWGRWGLGRSRRADAPLLLLWLAMAAALLLITRSVQSQPVVGTAPAWTRPFVAGDALAWYLAKVVWPLPLAIDYGRTPAFVTAHAWGYLTWLVPAALAVLLMRLRGRFPALTAAGAVFLFALLPVLGLSPFLFQAHSTVADRYLYLAMLGPALALAWLLTRVNSRRAVAAVAVCVPVFLLLGFLTLRQIPVWDSTETLFAHALSVNPRSWIIYTLRGQYRAHDGLMEQAIADDRAAIAILPTGNDARTALGLALLQTGRANDAIALFQDSVRVLPDFVDAYYYLGAALDTQGRTAEAANAYENVLRLAPAHALAHNALGLDLLKEHRPADALPHFQQAARLRPASPVPLFNVGRALDALGQTPAAIAAYQSALRCKPDYAEAHTNLAVDLEAAHRPADALPHFQAAARLQPANPQAQTNLRRAEAAAGR